jgi:hypothetical protein
MMVQAHPSVVYGLQGTAALQREDFNECIGRKGDRDGASEPAAVPDRHRPEQRANFRITAGAGNQNDAMIFQVCVRSGTPAAPEFAGGGVGSARECTMIKANVVLSVALGLLATGAVAAKDDRLPKLDIQKACRDRANSIVMLGTGLGNPFDQCMRSEETARAALAAAWKDIPPFYRTTCIQPNVFSPSYMEWIRCLELNIDVKNLRSKP